VINVNQAGETYVSISRANVNPKVTIQDYVDTANAAANVKSHPVADFQSRWNAEKIL